MVKEFQIGDLVWGKMKGYPHWPGKIVAAPPGSKPKKSCHYVFFFGSKNCGWVKDDSIEMHSDEILEKYKNRKGALLQNAIQCIVEHSKNESSHSSVSKNVSSQSSESIGSPKKPDTSDDEPQYENSPGDTSSVEMTEKDFTNEPSTSAAYFPREYIEECVQCFEDIFEPVSDGMASNAVIPHPNILHRKEPLEMSEYVERPQSPPFDFSQSRYLAKKNIVPTKKKIGFFGFTKKAQGIIKNFSHSGHSIIIWNENGKECKMFASKLKIKIASTAADLIKAADIIFSCVSDPDIAKDFVNGSLLREIELSKGKKGYVEMSNIPPEMSEMIATEIKMKGGLYLEAPFCGSRVDATQGTLYISTAGDKALYDDCQSCLDAISKKHVFISPEIGSAIKMNLVQNMFLGTTYVALAESMSMLETKGLGKDFVGMLRKSDLNSSDLVHKADAMASKNFQTETSINEMQENFTLGLALGHEVSHSTSAFSMANEAYKKAKMLNYSEHDVSAVLQIMKP